MTLKISDMTAVPNLHKPNSYEVVITTMSGDADGFDTLVVGPFHTVSPDDLEAMEDLLKTLDRVETTYPHGRGGGGRDEYDHVAGFSAWFCEIDSSEDPADAIALAYLKRHENFPNWPYDMYSDCQQSADKHKVLYYNVERDEFDVTVEILP